MVVRVLAASGAGWRTGALLVGAAMTAGCRSAAERPVAAELGAADGSTAAVAAGSAAGSAGGDAGTPSGAGNAQAKAALRGLPAASNVLMISIDSLRADMPWAGYGRDVAPRLTALEKKCVSYTRAYSVASHTAPSVGAMFFGKYPTELKRDGFFSTRFNKDNVSFVSLLKEAGVQTVAGHAHEYMRRAGWDQGFARYDLIPGLVWYPDLDENVTAKPLAELAQKQLTELGDLGKEGRFFAWYHFLDPHAKWLEHQNEGIASWGKKSRDLYDGEVTYADKYVGQLLDHVAAQPWADRTVVIFTSDHGEGVGDHAQNYHGYQVWETMVHVPLFVCAPGVAPRHVDTPRSLIDIGPTVLDVFGQKAPADYRGQSLVPEVLGESAPPRDVFVDLPANNHSFAKRALIGERYKIVYSAQWKGHELFDLQTDPAEASPAKKGPEVDEWSAKLDRFIGTLKEQKPTNCGAGCMKGW